MSAWWSHNFSALDVRAGFSALDVCWTPRVRALWWRTPSSNSLNFIKIPFRSYITGYLCEHDLIIMNFVKSRFQVQVKVCQSGVRVRKGRMRSRWGSDNSETSENPFLFVTVIIINTNSFGFHYKTNSLNFIKAPLRSYITGYLYEHDVFIRNLCISCFEIGTSENLATSPQDSLLSIPWVSDLQTGAPVLKFPPRRSHHLPAKAEPSLFVSRW